MDSASDTQQLRWFVEGLQMSARDGGACLRTHVSGIARAVSKMRSSDDLPRDGGPQ
jgi:hypothetical protein